MQAIPTENKENAREYGNFYPAYSNNIIHLGQSLFSHENFFHFSDAKYETAETLLQGDTTDDHNSDCDYDCEYDDTPLIYKKIPLANVLRPRRGPHRRGGRRNKHPVHHH
tara:strand:+ start:168 stop:497 length:330 start_codon:yes stop_codon:yes gene_type:complete